MWKQQDPPLALPRQINQQKLSSSLPSRSLKSSLRQTFSLNPWAGWGLTSSWGWRKEKRSRTLGSAHTQRHKQRQELNEPSLPPKSPHSPSRAKPDQGGGMLQKDLKALPEMRLIIEEVREKTHWHMPGENGPRRSNIAQRKKSWLLCNMR